MKKRTLEEMVSYWQKVLKTDEAGIDKIKERIKRHQDRLDKARKKVSIKETLKALEEKYYQEIKEIKNQIRKPD